MLQFFPESDNPAGIVARFRDPLAPGRYVVISQPTDEARFEVGSRAPQAFESGRPGHFQWLPEWHPDSPDDVDEHPEHSMLYAGAGRKE